MVLLTCHRYTRQVKTRRLAARYLVAKAKGRAPVTSTINFISLILRQYPLSDVRMFSLHIILS